VLSTLLSITIYNSITQFEMCASCEATRTKCHPRQRNRASQDERASKVRPWRRQGVRIDPRIDHVHGRRGISTLQIHVIVVVLRTVRGRRRSRDSPGRPVRRPEGRRVHSRQNIRHRMRTGPTGPGGVSLRGRRLQLLLGIGVAGVDGVVERVRVGRRVHQRADLVPQDPADGADRGNVVLVADAVREEPVADLPGEDSGVLLLQVLDVGHHFGGGDARLGAADGAGEDGAGLVVPGQDLGHATVGDAQLPGDVAGADAHLGQLDDPEADGVGQGAAVDEDAAELVDLPVLLDLALWNRIARVTN
jgi:hypothetical protein